MERDGQDALRHISSFGAQERKKEGKNKDFCADGFLQVDFLTALLPLLNLLWGRERAS